MSLWHPQMRLLILFGPFKSLPFPILKPEKRYPFRGMASSYRASGRYYPRTSKVCKGSKNEDATRDINSIYRLRAVSFFSLKSASENIWAAKSRLRNSSDFTAQGSDLLLRPAGGGFRKVWCIKTLPPPKKIVTYENCISPPPPTLALTIFKLHPLPPPSPSRSCLFFHPWALFS